MISTENQTVKVSPWRFLIGGTMPFKPKKPCRYPMCSNLTHKQYCTEHEKVIRKRYEKYKRDPETHRRYGRSWRKIRSAYVKENPYCERCFKNHILTPTEEVHHIIPLLEGGTHNKENLMSLCKSCHAKIHAERGDRWG